MTLCSNIPCRSHYVEPAMRWIASWPEDQNVVSVTLTSFSSYTRETTFVVLHGNLFGNLSKKMLKFHILELLWLEWVRRTFQSLFLGGNTCRVQEDTLRGYNGQPLGWQLSRERASPAGSQQWHTGSGGHSRRSRLWGYYHNCIPVIPHAWITMMNLWRPNHLPCNNAGM